jgi:hypothetical protein
VSETFEQAQAQERVKALQSGEAVDRPVEEHGGFHFGEFVRTIDDANDGSYEAGEEGTLVLQLVGRADLSNERVDCGVIFEGNDCPTDVDLMDIESA